MTKIFLSYRHVDADACDRIYDRLTRVFSKEYLYRDLDSIPVGVNYLKHLQSAVSECDVALVLIGPHWVDARMTPDSGRRLDDPRDVVRIEVEAALNRNIPVIPVLLAGTDMPAPEALPESLRELAYCNAARVRRDPDFHGDLERLIQALKALAVHQLNRDPTSRTESAPPAASPEAPPPFAPASENSPDQPEDLLAGMGLRIVDESQLDPHRSRVKLLAGATVGIDLGTTYSAIAQLSPDGMPVSIPNVDGKNLTPSVVLLGDNGAVVVGPTFERLSLESPDHVVVAIKRQMGNPDFIVAYQGTRLTPVVISALILKKLKQDAEKTIGPIANAVITVPYYFNDARRQATQEAGRIAGLNVIDVINEPTAAALAYVWLTGELGHTDVSQNWKTILVFDLGGGTFDVAVVRQRGAQIRVIATDGDVMLGGLDWTRRIVDHVAEQFQRKFGSDPRASVDSLVQLTQECEEAKRALSRKSPVPVTVYHTGKSLTLSLTRGDFQRMTSDLLQRCHDTTELVIQQAAMTPKDLDRVLLVGGATYMPAVEGMLTELCDGQTPSRELKPEEAVAQGAAIHAALIEAQDPNGGQRMWAAVKRRLHNVSFKDVCSHSLGIRVKADDGQKYVNHVLISRNTVLPNRESVRVATTSANQRSVRICVLQGEGPDPLSCSLLGEFVISDLPAGLPAGSPIDVTYHYDESGRIHVTAHVVASGQAGEVTIVGGNRLSEREIDGWENQLKHYQIE